MSNYRFLKREEKAGGGEKEKEERTGRTPYEFNAADLTEPSYCYPF